MRISDWSSDVCSSHLIALGNAEQPAFVSKTRARWQDTRRRYEAAADRLDRSADHEDSKLDGDVRTFLQERANIETVHERMLRDAEARVIAARKPTRTDPSPEPGGPRGAPPPPATRP